MRSDLAANILIILGLALIGGGVWAVLGWPSLLVYAGAALLCVGVALALRGGA